MLRQWWPGWFADGHAHDEFIDSAELAWPRERSRMSVHLHRDMENLQRMVLGLSASAEEMIDKATRVLCERRFDDAASVIAMDSLVDQREVAIEEECLKMLALHQPVASDLRRIAAVLKINNDVERIADLAVNIAQRAQCLAEFPEFVVPDRVSKMVDLTTQMVRGSMDAFVNLDAHAARRIIRLDDTVDQLNRDIIDELQTQMQHSPQAVPPSLHCFSAARHVERIADHAVNIAEDVIYLAEGDIVRHRHMAEA
jgi:phosphate transport system protein